METAVLYRASASSAPLRGLSRSEVFRRAGMVRSLLRTVRIMGRFWDFFRAFPMAQFLWQAYGLNFTGLGRSAHSRPCVLDKGQKVRPERLPMQRFWPIIQNADSPMAIRRNNEDRLFSLCEFQEHLVGPTDRRAAFLPLSFARYECSTCFNQCHGKTSNGNFRRRLLLVRRGRFSAHPRRQIGRLRVSPGGTTR